MSAALALCFAAALPAIAAEPPSESLAGAALLQALRGGGLILYFRHTSTDFGQNDDAMSGYEDCARQRNLTDGGRDEARRIGVAIKRLDIPIGDVLASPFCRTRETAQLIFGRATVAPAVRGGPARADSDDRYAELRKLLSTPPSRGTNLAIASHGNPFRAVTDTQYLAEGEAAVIRPLGAQGFRIVARIPKDSWDALTAP
jgi:histidine phosphatase superfamily protein (branch 1)